MPVLQVTELSVSFPAPGRRVRVVDAVSFSVEEGQTLGLIGESGSGKSMTAQALLRIVPEPGRLEGGRILLGSDAVGVDLASLDPDGTRMRRIRGREIGLVFQNPGASLSPTLRVSTQLCETLRCSRSLTRSQAERVAEELLTRVGLPDPVRWMHAYPHQLSGGMGQRVALALALAGNPRVLIADEPTTALDPPAQLDIVRLIRRVQRDSGLAVIFVSHDLRLVAQVCDEVAVVYAGQIVERGPTSELLRNPLHPYTRALLQSAPRLGSGRRPLASIPGVAPFASDRFGGCRFVDRCSEAMDGVCAEVPPSMVQVQPSRQVRCYLHSPAKHGKI